tara:strand:+ start:378 stop:809 length:432 start_codon:yes stop_codon:yes gene_type:complete
MENKAKPKVAMDEMMIGIDTPIVVSQITEYCLYSGFFGRLDSSRMKSVTDKILNTVEMTQNKMIIIDLSNIEMIDSAVVSHLLQIGTTLNLIGVKAVFCGIKSIVAQTMATLGIEFDKYITERTLSDALKTIYKLNGYHLVRI